MIYVKAIILRVITLASLALAGAVMGSAKPALVMDVSVHEAAGQTILEVALSRSAPFSISVNQAPARVLVDFGGVAFSVPQGRAPSQGLVKAWRSAAIDNEHGRLMVETTEPVQIVSSKLVPGLGQRPAQLVITLEKAATKMPSADGNSNLITGSLDKAEAVAAPQKIIVIDPGHGGADPGARAADGVAEKDVVLAFARTLKSSLEKTGHYKVLLTRDQDAFLSLEERVKFARDHQADLFLVIHADMLTGPLLQRNQVRGMTLYTVSDKASDAEAEALAQKENRADIIAGVDLGGKSPEVSNVLINLAQRESRAQALKFASKALAEGRAVTNVTSQPMRSAAFVVLKAPDVASVLIELGYLSNSLDEAQLQSDEWRNKMAAAFTRATDDFFAQPAVAMGK